MTMQCGECIYYGTNLSDCRRRAPGGGQPNFPVVDPVNDWCAEGYNETDGFYDQAPALPPAHYARTMKVAP